MDNHLNFIIILIFITLLYIGNLPETQNDFVVELPKRIEEIQAERREILKRACQVAGDLNQLASNGSSYETLLSIHRHIHNLSEPLL